MGASLSAMVIKKLSDENLKNNNGNGMNNAASVQASEVPLGGMPGLPGMLIKGAGKLADDMTEQVNPLRDNFILNFKQGE